MNTSSSGYVEQEHHYVPRGYFRPWENANRKVVVYERIGNRVVPPYLKSTKKICVKPGLYAYTASVKPEIRNVLEEKLFQRIDSEAARVLRILNSCDNVDDISNEDFHAFSFFLVSLRVRTPEFFEENAKLTERKLRQLIMNAEDDPAVQDLRLSLKGTSFIQFSEKYHLHIIENKGRELLAENLMNGRLVKHISGMHWTVISIPERAGISLVTSDRPLISKWANDTIGLLALPISPSRVFFACSNEADIDRLIHSDRRRLAQQVNIDTVQQAKAKAFAVDQSHSLRFFERRLGTRHSILPFSTSVDPELLDRRISEAAQLEEMISSNGIRNFR